MFKREVLTSSIAIALSLFPLLQATGEEAELRRGVGTPKNIASLPKHVVAPEGKLTLFADFKDVREETIVLYLVNRTKKTHQFDAQDGDIYVKLEFKNDLRKWARAQTHTYSWCGNSYMFSPKLKPDAYFTFLGHFPSKGEIRKVRYKRYSGNLDLVSNVGMGRVALLDVYSAKLDRMAVETGSYSYVSRIATGRIQIAKSEKDWVDMRHIAIYTLAQDRFKQRDAAGVLKTILKDKDQDIVARAQSALDVIVQRKKHQENRSTD